MGVLRWKWIRGYKGLYRVSEEGDVKSVKRYRRSKNNSLCVVKPRIIKQFMEKGYWYVNLWKNGKSKKFGIHQLLAMTYIPNPNDLPEACHLNDIKTDNRLENIVWGSRADNAKMAKINGRLKGNRTPKVANDEQVREIKSLLLLRVKRKEIARRFNVSYWTVTDIALGRTRKHITL